MYIFCFVMNFNLLFIYLLLSYQAHTLPWWFNLQDMAPGMYFNLILTEGHLSNKPARFLVDTLRRGRKVKNLPSINATAKWHLIQQSVYSPLSHRPLVPLSRGPAGFRGGRVVARVPLSRHRRRWKGRPCRYGNQKLPHTSTIPTWMILLWVRKMIYT